MTTITFLAGATKRIQVYNSVLVLPYRDPVILAKQMSTLDFLSGGRSILGIGIGHLEKEFEVLKVPRAERGPMSDEYLEAIKILWTEERPEFHGKYVEFDDIVFEPRPVAKPPSAHLDRGEHQAGDAPRRQVRRRLGTLADHTGAASPKRWTT